jgi:2-desacetyl-2-hydroxyethyl bacteriochlorophyllide A dehydrogenase
MKVEPKTMRAAVLVAPRSFEIREVPLPEPGPRQLRLRIEGSGLCGSNLVAWQGRPWCRYPLAPGAPGHEPWGRVDAVGERVTRFRVGDRVAALGHHAFAEYDLADEEGAVALPPSLDEVAIPGEPLGCAMNVLRRSEIRPGDRVAIIGIGFLGALLTNLAARAGARIIAVSRRSFALDTARAMGAATTMSLDEDPEDIVAAVEELTDGALCDRVIEAVGLQGPLDLAARLIRIRGRLVIAGYHQDGPRHVDLQQWNWRGIDVVNAHERDPAARVEGIRAAVDALASGRLDPTPLYTHRTSLAELERAFGWLEERPEGFIKGLVAP